MKIDQNRLVIKEEDMLASPTDWTEFVTFVVIKNSNGQAGSGEIPLLVCMDDEMTEKLHGFIKSGELKMYVIGHPTLTIASEKKALWEILAVKGNEGQKLYVGGENLRLFLDHHNIFYKSTLNEEGLLMSVTDSLYLKKDGENCREITKV